MRNVGQQEQQGVCVCVPTGRCEVGVVVVVVVVMVVMVVRELPYFSICAKNETWLHFVWSH